MPTPLDIVDSAVKIGLGALVSGVATYFVTRANHRHEFRKAAREDRRALIRNAAVVLEEATTLLNDGTFSIQKGGAQAAEGAKQIIDAINRLGEAKSIAVLLGNKDLGTAVTDLRAGAVELAHYVGPDVDSHDVRQINSLIIRMNEAWPAIYAELEEAYGRVTSDSA